MALDLTVLPLYRTNGQEAASMPGLLALVPPRKAARAREHDRLLAYLHLTGNRSFSSAECSKIIADAAAVFYQAGGSLTGALRAMTESINIALLESNMSTSGRGQYVVGLLTLAAVREKQCTLLLSGPAHVYHLSASGTRHIHEPRVSGKGLGLSQSANIHYSQLELQAGDHIIFCGKLPSAWETALQDATPSSLSATRRRLTTLTSEDLYAVLLHAGEGMGNLTVLQGGSERKEEPVPPSAPLPVPTLQARSTETRSASHPVPAFEPRNSAETSPDDASSLPRVKEAESAPVENLEGSTPIAEKAEEVSHPLPAHTLQPSAYAIPPQHEEVIAAESEQFITEPPIVQTANRRGNSPRNFPPSIPRARPQPEMPAPPAEEKVPPPFEEETKQPEAPREQPSVRARQAARALAGGIRGMRRTNQRVGEGLRKFLPRLLPGNEKGESPVVSTTTMLFIAIIAPLIVVTIASVVYLRYGRSVQYESYMNEANEVRAQAQSLTDPVEKRKAWETVLLNVERAEAVRKTDDAAALRNEANANLDQLLGIMRLPFSPGFSTNLGIEISRMAASETDLFLLNAAKGEVIRAQFTNGRGFQVDNAFNCAPGVYGGYTVGPLVDILALPGLNSINATLLGIDANGNLLYCAPNQVAQAIPLPPPDTNWNRVTAFVLDGGNLYVLDAQARAVWVYTGKDATFIDRPYFFFGGQTPEKQDVIDLLVSGDELYMLHSDGHLSNCSYSRIETAPTQCKDPVTLMNPFPAYQDQDLFGTAHITQIAPSAPPDTSLLLLNADDQSVFRITPRSFELQNQLMPAINTTSPVASGPVDAMAVGLNHVLYLAIDGQVYFATGMP